MKFSPAYLTSLAHRLLFTLDQEELEIIAMELASLDEQMKVFDKLDLTNVEPMGYPFTHYPSPLREDLPHNDLTITDLNQAEVVDNYIKVLKVVK